MKVSARKRIGIFFSCFMMALMTAFLPALSVNAELVFVSDETEYDEGYIFIGESHMRAAAYSMQQDALGNVPGLEGVRYTIYSGDDITHTMSGNLFFVFGATENELHNAVIKKEYIYSDGAGKRGGGVEKIHAIIDANPNIKHWNIVSFHGANAALKGSKAIADYYAASYRNWVDYEFPDADCYFLPQSTMTKNFKIFCKDKEVFNRTIAEALPDNFLDLMPFFWEHYPEGLAENYNKSDLVHWTNQTYYEMVSYVIRQANERRAAEGALPVQEQGQDFIAQEMLLYTNDTTVIYEQPDVNGKVLLASCEAGLPIHVTGVTGSGYFQIQLGETIAYVVGGGLSAQ